MDENYYRQQIYCEHSVATTYDQRQQEYASITFCIYRFLAPPIDYKHSERYVIYSEETKSEWNLGVDAMARTYEHHGVSMQRRKIVFDL